MKKLITGTMLAFSLFAAVLVCGGCQSNAEETATPAAPTAEQASANAVPQISPEAAKAAEAAMRRDKAGY